MPLTDAEKKQRKAAYNREWRKKNKDKLKEYAEKASVICKAEHAKHRAEMISNGELCRRCGRYAQNISGGCECVEGENLPFKYNMDGTRQQWWDEFVCQLMADKQNNNKIIESVGCMRCNKSIPKVQDYQDLWITCTECSKEERKYVDKEQMKASNDRCDGCGRHDDFCRCGDFHSADDY